MRVLALFFLALLALVAAQSVFEDQSLKTKPIVKSKLLQLYVDSEECANNHPACDQSTIGDGECDCFCHFDECNYDGGDCRGIRCGY